MARKSTNIYTVYWNVLGHSVRSTVLICRSDTLIDKAREDMERAAKSLDFLAAAKLRDRMYELQKLKEEGSPGSYRN